MTAHIRVDHPDPDLRSSPSGGEVEKHPEVVCIGEAMAQLSPVPPARLRDAAEVRLAVAGAESTVALYLSQFGHRSAWVSRIGADPLGLRIRDQLEQYGVDTRWLETDPTRPTGAYLKDPTPSGTTVYYYRKGSAASAMTPALITPPLMSSARLVHVTGITPALSESCNATATEIFRSAAAYGCTISFDVNYRPQVWADRDAAVELREFANLADIVFVGLDEAEEVWGTTTPAAVRALLPGPRELVVKDGARGVTLFDGATDIFEPALPVEVIEPVGAGDSFAAGYLHEWLGGHNGRCRLRTGHALAAAALRTTADFVELEETNVAEHRASHAGAELASRGTADPLRDLAAAGHPPVDCATHHGSTR
ncbi:2-dehydro-3-deoxygluconokinase [Rhodococcus wratislaviensis]|uniref:Carbohydrate kinase n=1 Tax=Rhodococcus wratislaviensis TaxID=44752 RepID=A0AB38FD09_RHOWR|nr:sugar kinase [Rhodococcus wratislaviensis]REE75451.1 2-dehydro-3-deoxygluconokinase [Rhodococcus wratislaviensis]SPZ39515.1 carbohydrate kinase [Rhodococcus wratislaviensis]